MSVRMTLGLSPEGAPEGLRCLPVQEVRCLFLVTCALCSEEPLDTHFTKYSLPTLAPDWGPLCVDLCGTRTVLRVCV